MNPEKHIHMCAVVTNGQGTMKEVNYEVVLEISQSYFCQILYLSLERCRSSAAPRRDAEECAAINLDGYQCLRNPSYWYK